MAPDKSDMANPKPFVISPGDGVQTGRGAVGGKEGLVEHRWGRNPSLRRRRGGGVLSSPLFGLFFLP